MKQNTKDSFKQFDNMLLVDLLFIKQRERENSNYLFHFRK